MRPLIVFLLVALPLHARADDPKLEAKQHIDRASVLHKEERFSEALDELKTAYALDPQPQLLFAMGQLHVSLGQCDRAITYYERFLTTKPSPEVAAVANEAIVACKTDPPPAAGIPKPKPEPAPLPEPEPKFAPAPLAQPRRAAVAPPAHSPWYRDYLADGLVVGGLVSGGLGIWMFERARSDRDEADGAMTYGAYNELIDRAQAKRTYAVVFGVLGGVALTAGGLRFLRGRKDRGVSFKPAIGGGGTLTWTARF